MKTKRLTSVLMSAALLFALFFVLAPTVVKAANTDISGAIDQNYTVNSGDTLTVTGDVTLISGGIITVKSGGTLTINAGSALTITDGAVNNSDTIKGGTFEAAATVNNNGVITQDSDIGAPSPHSTAM